MTTKVAPILTSIPLSNISVSESCTDKKASTKRDIPLSNTEAVVVVGNTLQTPSFSKEDAIQTNETTEPSHEKKTFRFYAIIVALALAGLLSSLEATITSTALPTIVADLGGAELFIWVVNGFYLTQ